MHGERVKFMKFNYFISYA